MVYLLEYDSVGRVQDRQTEHERGRELLRFGLDRQYGIQGSVRQETGGKPYLENAQGIYFNISHTRGLVVCGIDDREIGIDVECIRPYDERLMHRICTKEEIAYICANDEGGGRKQNEKFFQLWTLKESYLKATGQGIGIPMQEVSFLLDRDYTNRIQSNVSGWEFSQFRYAGKYLISLCRESY